LLDLALTLAAGRGMLLSGHKPSLIPRWDRRFYRFMAINVQRNKAGTMVGLPKLTEVLCLQNRFGVQLRRQSGARPFSGMRRRKLPSSAPVLQDLPLVTF